MAWLLYCLFLRAPGGGARTYVGVTTDLRRRLRQHNGKIAGGARYTRLVRAQFPARRWRLLFTVRGLPDRRAALQWEWRLHRPQRFAACAVCHRALALRAALALPRVTASARPTAGLALRVRWHARAACACAHAPTA